ncbi:hypothetical protein [Streptomyces sp. NPDC053048]|uniref:hypothetical protein n=1 Tax=Streptomyces sp. NPDC053048 TaxID=3365694 RepID=UPI0037CD02AD
MSDWAIAVALRVKYPGSQWDKEQIESQVKCWLADHGAGPHQALVRELNGDESVWVSWQSGDEPHSIRTRKDCPKLGPDDDEGCTLYDRHDGPCGWEIRDPEKEAVIEQLKKIVPGVADLFPIRRNPL